MIAAWITLTGVEHVRLWLWGPLTAGITAGAAVMVTPHRGALTMLAAATAFLNLRRYRAELMAYAVGCALVPVCILAYIIRHNALVAAVDDVILFTTTRYSSINTGVPFGAWAGIHLTWMFPLAGLIAVLAFVRGWRNCLQDRVFWTCVAVGLAGFAGCFPRPDELHISVAAPLVCPLLAYGVNRFTRPWAAKYRYAAAALAIASLIPSARGFWFEAEKALYGDIVPMPRGGITSPLQGMRSLAVRIAATPSGDAYFFYPYDAMLPFLTARRHVSTYDIFTPGYTTPSQYQEACVLAMRGASWVVTDRTWTPKRLTTTFPGIRDPDPPEKKRFEQALETGFEFVAREGLFELRRRVRGVDETLCTGITE
jgi:hypothetical protein